MRAIAIALVVASAIPTAAAAPAKGSVAVYWQPPGDPPLGVRANGAFVRAVALAAERVLDASEPRKPPASLVPALDAAKADYARFAFAEAIVRLSQLEQAAALAGGGDLDRRQLSEIFFYRGLSRLETDAAAAAWDDLVRAARLDPNRIVDPNAFPPRAVTAYKRAVTEVAALPGAELELVVPSGGQARVDGTPARGTVRVTLGQHYVSVTAIGFVPWTGVVSVSSERERLAPSLEPERAPEADRLLELAGPATQRLIVGSLERTPAGWRFAVRDLRLPGGPIEEEAAALDGVPTEPTIEALVARRTAPSVPEKKRAKRGSRWGWIVVGGAAVVLAVVVGVAAASDGADVVGNLD